MSNKSLSFTVHSENEPHMAGIEPLHMALIEPLHMALIEQLHMALLEQLFISNPKCYCVDANANPALSP